VDLPNVLAIRLSRNFGKEAALCAALEAAHGDACVVMDSDLQHPPEIIPQMVRMWREEGYDVVEGVKSSRGKESITTRWVPFILLNIENLSGFNLDGASDFKLLDSKVVASWRIMPERNTFSEECPPGLDTKEPPFPSKWWKEGKENQNGPL